MRRRDRLQRAGAGLRRVGIGRHRHDRPRHVCSPTRWSSRPGHGCRSSSGRISRATSGSAGRPSSGSTSTARSPRFCRENFPVFIWEAKGSTQGIYGFPAIDGAGGGVKIATEQFETTTTPEAVERAVGAEEIAAMYDRLRGAALSGGHRQVRAGDVVPVHGDARFRIRDRPASGQRSGDRRVALLGPRLQAFRGDRRGARGACDGGCLQPSISPPFGWQRLLRES